MIVDIPNQYVIITIERMRTQTKLQLKETIMEQRTAKFKVREDVWNKIVEEANLKEVSPARIIHEYLKAAYNLI